MSFYRRHLPHFQRDYKPHFVKFANRGRRKLPEWAREIVLESCVHGHQQRYNLRVALVMPDHAHLILTPLVDWERRRMFKLHEIIGSIKKYSARRINQLQGCGSQLWQQESFGHVLRSSESLDAKVAYILANPVRAGLVNVHVGYRWKWERPNVVVPARTM